MVGTYWRNICWGHLVSEDMVHWKPVREAITPMENTVVPDGVWSGGAAMDANGVPILFFTAGNDDYAKDGLISNQNIGAAYPADLSDPDLTDWVVCDRLAIRQTEGEPASSAMPISGKKGISGACSCVPGARSRRAEAPSCMRRRLWK